MQHLRQHREIVQPTSHPLHERTANRPQQPQRRFPVDRHLRLPLPLHPLVRAERYSQIRHPRALLLPAAPYEGKLDLDE